MRSIARTARCGGRNSQELADSGSDNVSGVDQIPPVDDLSYVARATPGQRHLYAVAPLGSTPLAILGLQQTVLVSKNNDGQRSPALMLKSGAAVAVGPATPLSSSYAFVKWLHESDPAIGASWILTAAYALQSGMEAAS